MQEVFVLIGHDQVAEYNDEIEVLGVFSTRENAERAIEALQNTPAYSGYTFWVEFYRLDQI